MMCRIFLNFLCCDHHTLSLCLPLTQHPYLPHVIMQTAGLAPPADKMWDIALSFSEHFNHYKDSFLEHKQPGCLMQGPNVNNHTFDGTMILTHRLGLCWSDNEGPPLTFPSYETGNWSHPSVELEASNRDSPIVPDDNASCWILLPCALLMAISRCVSDRI